MIDFVFLFSSAKMLTMGRRGMLFILATSIVLCARRGHSKVFLSYEEVLASLADKNGAELQERTVDTRNSGRL